MLFIKCAKCFKTDLTADLDPARLCPQIWSFMQFRDSRFRGATLRPFFLNFDVFRHPLPTMIGTQISSSKPWSICKLKFSIPLLRWYLKCCFTATCLSNIKGRNQNRHIFSFPHHPIIHCPHASCNTSRKNRIQLN